MAAGCEGKVPCPASEQPTQAGASQVLCRALVACCCNNNLGSCGLSALTWAVLPGSSCVPVAVARATQKLCHIHCQCPGWASQSGILLLRAFSYPAVRVGCCTAASIKTSSENPGWMGAKRLLCPASQTPGGHFPFLITTILRPVWQR